MWSDRWYYLTDPLSTSYNVLHVKHPITRKQALYILKKKLQIKEICYIVAHNDKTWEPEND